jgi:hypothetical protein
MTFGRTLKKALLQCGQSPGFSVWSKVAADRAEWRKLRGQMTPTPRPKPTAFDEQVREIFYGPPLPNAPAAPAAPAVPATPAAPGPAVPAAVAAAPVAARGARAAARAAVQAAASPNMD